MPPLRGSHLFFCGCSRGSVASPLHHRAILWRPSGAHEFGGRAPAGRGRFFSPGWPMNGCMGAIPRHALCHPGFAFVFWGGSRGLGLRVCAFYALRGRPCGLLYGAPSGAQMTIKGVMRGSRRNMKGAMVMEPTRQRGASVTIMTALPA